MVDPAPADVTLVQQVWCEILDVPSVGSEDNFFFLGGHSLLILEAVDKLESMTGIEVPLRLFFDEPTPSGIAAYLTQARIDQPNA